MRRSIFDSVRWPFILSLLANLALCPVAALAESDHDIGAARVHYDTAMEYYQTGRYLHAAEEFRLAYDLSGRPHLLRNVARAYERGEAFAQAAETLREYLSRHQDASDVQEVRALLKELESKSERLESRLQPENESARDESPPHPESVRENPVDKPAPAIDSSNPPPMDDESDADVLTPTLMIAGGAALVGAVITGALAIDRAQSLDEHCEDRVCPRAQESTRDEGRLFAWTSTGLTVVAVAAATWVLLRWTLDDDDHDGTLATTSVGNGDGITLAETSWW